MKTVDLYSKSGCHLCDAARQVIESVKEEIDFRFTEINIEKDPELLTQYKEDIPVIYINGAFFSKYNVDKAELIDRLGD